MNIPLTFALVMSLSVAGVALVATTIFAREQAPGAALAFEAASVKANKSGSPQGDSTISPGGRFTATNLSLQVLIRFAYERSPRSRGLEPFEVTGGPDWLATDRFDINAIGGREVSLAELRSMLQALLIKRFNLKAHYETRQGPPDQPEPCGYFGPSPTVPLGSDKAYQAFRGLTMEDFALRLYPYLNRRVIDATGLAGYFDGDFEFTTEIVMPPPPPGLPNPYDGRALPSIFSVLPQQLGLRLESTRGPIEIVVVDHAERPTDD